LLIDDPDQRPAERVDEQRRVNHEPRGTALGSQSLRHGVFEPHARAVLDCQHQRAACGGLGDGVERSVVDVFGSHARVAKQLVRALMRGRVALACATRRRCWRQACLAA